MQRKKLMDTPMRMTRPDVPDLPEKNQNRRFNLCYDAYVDDSTSEDVLVIDFYLPKEKSLHKRLFFNGEKRFTEYADGTVSRESLKINGEFYHDYSYTPINDWCDLKIKGFMRSVVKAKKYKLNEHSAMEMVSDYQDRLREKNLEDKYNRIKDSISREMLEITPTPDKFIQWVDKELMPKYLFYIYVKAKRVEAHCSFCGETVTIERPRKDDVVRCPHCRQTCTAKPLRLHNNSAGFNDIQKNVFYLQPLKEYSEQISIFSESKERQEQELRRLEDENEALKNRPVEVAVQEPSQEQIEKAVAAKTKELENDYKSKLKKAKEKERKKAEAEKKKAIEEARTAAKAEADAKYKEQIAQAKQDKEAALSKAKEIASKLDKNADRDLVTASLFFSEAQAQFEKFLTAANKITDEKGTKIKKVAADFLKQYIDRLL